MTSTAAAIFRRVAPSLPKYALRDHAGSTAPIDFALAVAQHESYMETIQSALPDPPDFTVLPADETYPDCVFVEDAAITLGGTALVTNSGALSR